jgi:hypothetical protein
MTKGMMTMPRWIDACATDDIEEEDLIRFDHDGRTFAIYHSPDGEFLPMVFAPVNKRTWRMGW